MRTAEIARATMFALLAPAAAGGALALAPLVPFFGFVSWRPSLALPALRKPPLYLLLLAAFIVWMAVTMLWGPENGRPAALQLAVTSAGGLMFVRAAYADADALRLTRAGVLAALTVLAILLSIEAAAGMPMNHAANPGNQDWQIAGNPGRGVVVLLCLLWGALALLASRRAWLFCVAMLAAGGMLALQFGQSANIFAFAAGAAAFAGGWLAPRIAIWATSGGVAAWLLLAPFLSPLVTTRAALELPYSWANRIEIWRYVSAQVLERPLFGWGLGAARADEETIIVFGRRVSAIPVHPHSGSLQIWLETGGVGAILAAAAIMAGGWALARAWGRYRPGAAAACGSMAAIGIIANVSFGIWQSWWHAAMLIAAAAVAGLARRA